MVPSRFIVVLDANVLFPFTLRDTLLRAASYEFFQMRWSADILDEMQRNLVDEQKMNLTQAKALRRQMETVFPDAEVNDYQALIPGMKNDEKDRHVVAAAVKAGAQVIVTINLKDFHHLPEGLEAQSPDDFLSNLFDLSKEQFVELLKEQAGDLRRPPVTFDELLGHLAKVIPDTIASVREHLDYR